MLFRDFIASNAGAISTWVPFEKGIDADGIKISLSRDGVINDGGRLDCRWGQWDNAVFQVNKALEQGYEVEKGQIIMTGSLGKIVPAELGDHATRYDGHWIFRFRSPSNARFLPPKSSREDG